MVKHISVRATPPGFEHLDGLLPGVYTPGYCVTRLRRSEPRLPWGFTSTPLTVSAIADSGVPIRCHTPTAIRII